MMINKKAKKLALIMNVQTKEGDKAQVIIDTTCATGTLRDLQALKQSWETVGGRVKFRMTMLPEYMVGQVTTPMIRGSPI